MLARIAQSPHNAGFAPLRRPGACMPASSLRDGTCGIRTDVVRTDGPSLDSHCPSNPVVPGARMQFGVLESGRRGRGGQATQCYRKARRVEWKTCLSTLGMTCISRGSSFTCETFHSNQYLLDWPRTNTWTRTPVHIILYSLGTKTCLERVHRPYSVYGRKRPCARGHVCNRGHSRSSVPNFLNPRLCLPSASEALLSSWRV